MTPRQRGIALAVLGAGIGSRFGGEDKLATCLEGRPVAQHLLPTVNGFDWARRILICRGAPDWTVAYEMAGFSVVSLLDASRGLRGSLLAAVAQVADLDRVLVCLADMPRVTAEHLQRLLDEVPEWPGAIASTSGAYRGPPAILPIHSLKQFAGSVDAGARELLYNARLVTAAPEVLVDIDTREDIARVMGSDDGFGNPS